MVSKKPKINDSIDTTSCHTGGFDANRPIITIGEVNGIILAQTMAGASGLSMFDDRMIKPKTMGIIIGNISDWASWGSSFTTLPIAANNDE